MTLPCCLATHLKIAELSRALEWLPDVWLEDRALRFDSYHLFSLTTPDFYRSHDHFALTAERARRRAFQQPNVLGEVA